MLLTSLPRIEGAGTGILALEDRMFCLLVRGAGVFCGELTIAIVTFEYGRVLLLLMSQAAIVRHEFENTVFALERGRVHLLLVSQAAFVRLEFANTVFALERGRMLLILMSQAALVRLESEVTVFARERRWMFDLLMHIAAKFCGELAVAIATFNEGVLVRIVLVEALLRHEWLVALCTGNRRTPGMMMRGIPMLAGLGRRVSATGDVVKRALTACRALTFLNEL